MSAKPKRAAIDTQDPTALANAAHAKPIVKAAAETTAKSVKTPTAAYVAPKPAYMMAVGTMRTIFSNRYRGLSADERVAFHHAVLEMIDDVIKQSDEPDASSGSTPADKPAGVPALEGADTGAIVADDSAADEGLSIPSRCGFRDDDHDH
jgi:hypothetical protein